MVITHGSNAVSSPIADMSGLFCTQEDADTRFLFYASHLFHHGYNMVMVHATDTDVVVAAVSLSSIFQNCEVWIAFGHGNKLRYITSHLIANELGTDAFCRLLLSTLYQDVILFQHSVGLERKQPGLFGAVCLT